MSRNNFSSKTVAQLEAMAKSYKTEIASFLTEPGSPTYEIADISKDELQNITSFVMNSVIKNGKEIELSETEDSRFFSKMLKKYFEEEMTIQDVIKLKQFVNRYNKDKSDFIYQNIYSYVYGITENLDDTELGSPYLKIVGLIKNKIKQLEEAYSKFVYEFNFANDEWVMNSASKYTTIEPLSPVVNSKFYDLTENRLFTKSNSWFRIGEISTNQPKNVVNGVRWVDVRQNRLFRYYNRSWDSGREVIIGTSGTTTPATTNVRRNSYFLNLTNPATLQRFDGTNWVTSDVPAYFYSITNNTLYTTWSGVYYNPNSTTNYIGFPAKKNTVSWFGGTTNLNLNNLSAKEFIERYIDKSKIVEGMVLLVLISFLDTKNAVGVNYPDRGAFFNAGNGTIIRDLTRILEARDFFIKDPSSTYSKDFNFINEDVYLVNETQSIRYDENLQKYYRRLQKSLEVKDSSNKRIMFIPVRLDENEVLISQNIYTDVPNTTVTIDVFNPITLVNNKTTFLQLYQELKDNLYGFIDQIKNFEDNALSFPHSYFFSPSQVKIVTESIRVNIVEVARLFYYKDLIQDNSYLENTPNPTKNFANQFEQTSTKDGQQIIFIDIKDMDISKESQTIRDTVRSLFNYPVNVFSINKFTYTVLYKELNESLRESCMIDNQEFIFARLMFPAGIGKQSIFEAKRSGVSFLTSINSLYKLYEETSELFKLVDEFYRYKYFYNNMYISRLSNESDLIGYYVGDNTEGSSFINNYGSADFQKQEIASFLNIYRSTRNFYYQVLLNKSFLQEEEYKLYERMIIIFMAIERFMNSKIDNIHNPDYFNSTDIYNFLESYGLSILNQERFNFVIGSKDYKLNIVKYFNDLVKLKGSKDVISVLLKVFDIPDISVEIKKFLILEKTAEDAGYWNIAGGVDIKYIGTSGLLIDRPSIDLSYYGKYYFAEDTGIIYIGFADPLEWSVVSLQSGDNFYSINKNLFFQYDLAWTDGEFIDSEQVPVLNKRWASLSNSKIYSFVASSFNRGSVKFIEVPYFSDNGSREINTALPNAYDYEDFIKDDPFWNTEDVPQSTLLELGLDVAETKYLGLILSENIYRKYILSRYTFSALDYLEKYLIRKEGLNTLYNTRLEAGEVFNISSSFISIYNYFEAIKVVYKALLTLYGVQGNIPDISNVGDKFYGINKNVNWTKIEEIIESITTNFNSNKDEFLKASRKVGNIPTKFDKFNIYKEGNNWINFDPSLGSSNRNIFYKENDYSNLTEIARQLKDSVFSTHKTNYGKSDVVNEYQNSGEYVVDLIENLNLLKIDNDNHDLWMYILSKFYDTSYNIPIDNAAFTPGGSNLDYKELYYKVLEKMIKFPVDYFDGLLSPYRDPELYHNKEFIDLVKEIIDEVYVAHEDALAFTEYWLDSSDSYKLYKYSNKTWNLINGLSLIVDNNEPVPPIDDIYWVQPSDGVVPTNDYNLFQYKNNNWQKLDRYVQVIPPIPSELGDYLEEPIEIIQGSVYLEPNSEDIELYINKYTRKILELINGIKTLFSSEAYMQFSLSLKTEEQETLEFVQTAVEVFLSYTTELYYTTYKKTYNSLSEIIPLSEDVFHKLETRKMDFVFYDESLTVELVSEGDE
jgi:hypothetical protein